MSEQTTATGYRLECGHYTAVAGPAGATTGRAWCATCGESRSASDPVRIDVVPIRRDPDSFTRDEGWRATTGHPELRGVVFEWYGGEYVEYGLEGHPVDVFNVYDYEKGGPSIDRTAEALAGYLAERLAEPDERETVSRAVAMS